MLIVKSSSPVEWPKPPVEAKSVSRPKHIKNVETRDHLAGKTLCFSMLKIELEQLRVEWQQTQNTRDRSAIYDFLEASYRLVSRYGEFKQRKRLLRELHRLDGKLKRIKEPHAAVIHYASAHSVDSRTRSKWSRIMRRAEREKKSTELLENFIRRKGGINECATPSKTDTRPQTRKAH